jgi:TRAP-type C4-dicarboxylate transport system permease small subunit
MRFVKRFLTLFLDVLDYSSTGAGVFFFSVMTAIAFVSVILRYFFEIHILWETQILPFLFIWGVFLGAASVTRDNSHIRVNFFAEKIFGEKRAVKVWTTVENIAGLAASIYITQLSFRWVQDEIETGAIIVSRPSYGAWIPHMGIMIGMGLVAIFYAERLVRQILLWRTPETKAENEEENIGQEDVQLGGSVEIKQNQELI